MSADDAEPQKSSPPYLAIAGALFLGVVVGAAFQGGDDAALKVKRELETRVEAAEAAAAAAQERAAAAIADAEAAAAAGAEQAAQSAAAQVSEFQSKLDEVAAEAAASGDAEELKALSSRVQVLAEQMAAMIASAQSGGAMPAPAETPAAEPAAEAAPADEAGEAAPSADAETLAAAIGEDGLALAVGQTGAVGEARVFMSRIDAETGEARIMIVGEGPTLIGGGAGPVELANGCAMSLEGVADNRAYIKVDCAD
jgi:hypothetical protein